MPSGWNDSTLTPPPSGRLLLSETCSTPGTAYTKPAFPNAAYKVYNGQPGPSPDCGYRYQTAGSYGVTATVTWLMAFQVGSTTGTFVVSRTTKIKMMNIGELQAVTE